MKFLPKYVGFAGVLCSCVIQPRSGAAEPVSKNAMLEGIVQNVVVRGYRELALKCRALTIAAEELGKTPTAESLGKTRQAWLAAQQSAREMQWLQTGPIADLEYLSTFYYSKLLTNRIEDVLRSSRVH
jgi:predicted lipoprotein